MNELAKDLGIELKPFCVRSDEFPSAQICQDMLDRCVSLGAEAEECVTDGLNYPHSYSLYCCRYWGISAGMYTYTDDRAEDNFNHNVLTYQEMLDYLQLTEKGGRLVPNEEILKENNPMHTVDVVNGKVQLHKFPDNACVESPVSSSEPVSMIKGKVVPAELERLLELIVGEWNKDCVLLDGVSLSEGDTMYEILALVETLIQDECMYLKDYSLFSEHSKVTLDKQIKEAEDALLEAQQKLDELKKQRGE